MTTDPTGPKKGTDMSQGCEEVVLPQLHVKWVIKRDFPDLIDLETHSCETFWSKAYLSEVLDRSDTLGLTSKINLNCVGSLFYRVDDNSFEILNLVVHPDFRRLGVGKRLLNEVKNHLNSRRNTVRIVVRETNRAAHRFLTHPDCGFRSVGVLSNHFCDVYWGETEYSDGYVFEYKLD